MAKGAVFVYDRVEIRKRNKLPHWHVPGGLYFLTYRLGDSLPVKAEQRIENAVSAERKRLFNEGMRGSLLEEEIARFAFRKIQPILDRGLGSCILRENICAEEVVRCWEHGNRSAYDLIAWCVMPNHAHLVTRLLGATDISDMIESWKSITTRRINRSLRRAGSLWQEDYFDVLVRDERQLRNTIAYVMNNPAKAGLQESQWTRMYDDGLARVLGM